MKERVTIGIDMGGTNTAFGIVDINGKCVAEGAVSELGSSLEDFFLAKVGDVRDFKLAGFLAE